MRKEIVKDKSLEELMEFADQQSRGYFRQGLNCTECVFRTFMDIYETGLPDEVICMATGFTLPVWMYSLPSNRSIVPKGRTLG